MSFQNLLLRGISILVIAVPVLLTGCAGGGGGQRPEKPARSELDDLRAIQAEQTATLAQLNTEMRQLQGKVEELQFQNKNKTAEIEKTLRTFSTRVPPPPGVPEDLLNEDEASIQAATGAAADQFREGLQAIRTGDFDHARQTFESFVNTNPQTAYSDNAYFWIGVSFEKLSQFDRAVVSYSEVFQKYPAEDRVPAALFFLGQAFAKIGSNDDAVVTLQKLVDEHPRSSFAEEARARIKQLAPAKSVATKSKGHR